MGFHVGKKYTSPMGSYGFGISDKQYLWLLRDFMTDIYIFLGGGFNPIEKY